MGKWRPIGVGLGEVQPCERRLVTAGRYVETVGSPSSQRRHGKASPSPPGPATPGLKEEKHRCPEVTNKERERNLEHAKPN